MCAKNLLWGQEENDSEYLREDLLESGCLVEHSKQHEFLMGDQPWKTLEEVLMGHSQIVEWFRKRCCEHLQQALPL
jgi:hypothetical protein